VIPDTAGRAGEKYFLMDWIRVRRLENNKGESMGFLLARTLLVLIAVCFSFSPVFGGSPAVHPEHPRLFFRSQDWGPRGLTLEMLKERARRPGAESILAKLDGSLPNLAMRSLLTNDEKATLEAVERLKEPVSFNGTTSDGILVGQRAMAFDWLYHHPLFTDEEKTIAAGHIAEGARRLIRQQESEAHIFHTRMYGWAMGIALAGLAVHGDHPQAESFIRFGGAYFKEKLFPARRLQDGSVHNSFGYGRKYTMWLTSHFISCWYSATGENLWEDIQDRQGDWARKEILFNIYGRYPDGTYLRFGDSYSLLSDHYTFRAISERTRAYRDPVGAGFLKLLIAENEGKVVEKPTAYIYFLFYDPDAPGVSHTTLPTKVLFSPKGTGMVIWKSGWDHNGTTVLFKCGNYFGNHGHFDQGHLDIYRGAPLLIDSGSYLTFAGPFRMEYWRKTVAHNTILVMDPAVADDDGCQRIFHSQSDSSITQYLGNTQSETGDILEYKVEPGLAYVAGEITAAYPEDRVRRVTRELAFVDDRYLVVLDRIVTRRPELVPRVLWHCPVLPTIDIKSRRFEVARNGARAAVAALLPEKAKIEWVEGFRAGGKTIAAEGTLKGLDDMGVGRIEVSGGTKETTNHLFIHLIDIADSDDPITPGSATMNENGIAVQVGVRTITFRTDRPGLVD